MSILQAQSEIPMAYPRVTSRIQEFRAKPAAHPKTKAAAVSSKIKSAANKSKTAVTAKLATAKTTAAAATAQEGLIGPYAALYRGIPYRTDRND